MKKPRAVILVVGLALVALLVWPALAEAETTELVSVSSSGDQGNGVTDDEGGPSISADGSTVAFSSEATNLAGPETLDFEDIFVHNLLTGATALASVAYDGTSANGDSYEPSLNADGTIVAFSSNATNLIDEALLPEGFVWNEGPSNIFVRYLLTNVTELVSVSSDGLASAESSAYSPSISADGLWVAFDSGAFNLTTDDGPHWDVFVRDLEHGTTEVVSVDSDEKKADGDSHYASINADGSMVAFESEVSLSSADTDAGDPDVYVRNRNAGVTELASVDGSGIASDSANMMPSINADGSVVAFMSYQPDATAGADVFVRDLSKGVTELVSVSAGGVGSDDENLFPSINADGSIVAFMSAPLTSATATASISTDTAVATATINEVWNIFVRDRKTGVTKLLSVGWDGSPSNGDSWIPSISAKGSRVAYGSEATNLVKGDVNGFADVFVTTYTRYGYPNRYEQTDLRILYSGQWETQENKAHSGGSIYFTNDKTATITITFKGTRLDWIAALGPLMGKALVSIDGGEPVLVDLFSDTELFQQLVWSTGDLEYGVHTITITFPEGSDYQEGKGINLDALDVWGVLLANTET